MLHGGEVRPLDDDWRIEYVPRVVVEVSPDHLPVVGPAVERSRSRVHGDEALAVLMNEREQIALLLLAHLRLAIGVEHYGVEVVQVPASRLTFAALRIVAGSPDFPFRHELGVRPDERDVSATLAPESLERSHRVAHGIV